MPFNWSSMPPATRRRYESVTAALLGVCVIGIGAVLVDRHSDHHRVPFTAPFMLVLVAVVALFLGFQAREP